MTLGNTKKMVTTMKKQQLLAAFLAALLCTTACAGDTPGSNDVESGGIIHLNKLFRVRPSAAK